MSVMLRPFPAEARPPGVLKFLEGFRRAFDADPGSTFCAGEFEGLVLVIARNDREAGEKLLRFITNDLDGVIQRRVENGQPSSEQA